jgi:hypothetical protein
MVVGSVRTVELSNEVGKMQSADEGEVPGFLREQTGLLVLRCIVLALVLLQFIFY